MECFWQRLTARSTGLVMTKHPVHLSPMQVHGAPGARLVDMVRSAEDFLLSNSSERLNATVCVARCLATVVPSHIRFLASPRKCGPLTVSKSIVEYPLFS